MQHFLPKCFAPFRCKQALLWSLASFLLFPLILQAQPRLVKDIYPNQNQGTGEPLGSSLAQFINVNGTVYFVGEDGIHGLTLWKTNGTAQSTVKVAPGKIFGVSNLNSMNGLLYFIASGGITGNDLWKSDGTAQGTVRVAPGKAGNIRELIHINGTLYFTDDGNLLWKSDGTEAGTVKVLPNFESNLFNLQKVGNLLYFNSYNFRQNYTELWKSDGTRQGTVKVAGGWKYSTYNFSTYNNQLFFVSFDNETGRNDLWKTDGTEAGTVRVAPGKFAAAYSFIEALGSLFFVGNDSSTGLSELWKTDGTAEGTIKVAPGRFNNVANFVLMNNTLYFTASDTTTYYTEIWKTDGTEEGTIKIAPGKAYFANNLTNIKGTLFFTAFDYVSTGTELWKSDGTEQGTVLVKDIVPGIESKNLRNFVEIKNSLLFTAIDDLTHYTELWKSDGTEQGTQLIKYGVSSSKPEKFTGVNGELFFTAFHPEYGEELWKSDGTEQGTTIVKDITSGPAGSNITQMASVNNLLFFTTGDFNNNLWKSDGSATGTQKVLSNIPNVYQIAPSNNHLFFLSNGLLWKTDGKEANTLQLTTQIQNPWNLTDVNGTLFYTATNSQHNHVELWKSDGTIAGTVLVSILPSLQENTTVSNLVSVNRALYFTVSIFNTGASQLWKSDGTAEGTAYIKDIYLEPNRIFSMSPVDVNGTLFFNAKMQNGSRFGLWKSDGTETGTVSIASEKVMNPKNLTAVNGLLFFNGFDYINGEQVWKSDGTAEGTVSLSQGKLAFRYYNNEFIELNNKLIFTASGTGYSLAPAMWQSDGTYEGTELIKKINPGVASYTLNNLIKVNGKLFFVADEGITGGELWVYDPVTCTAIDYENITINPVNVCVGENASILINNSQVGVTYKAVLSGNFSFWELDYPFGEPAAGGGNVSLTLPTADLEPGIYTIEIYASGCTEQKLPNSVTITVNALPEAATAAPVTIYAGEKATLSITNVPTGASFKWYTQATGGTPIAGATSSTYVTPMLTVSATYYVAVVSACGESERTAVAVTVIGSPCTASGTILREVWEEVPGSALSIVPFHTAPSLQSQITGFEAPSNTGNNYGQRIRGYLCPPQTGNYTFWIAGDDNCELWLSTNDDPATKTKIAHITGANAWTGVRIWNKYASQQSTPIYLQAGQKYYIEALHKEEIGNDNLAVGWQLPDSTMERPISGQRLSPYVPYGKGTLVKETWANVMGNTVSQIPLQTEATTIGEISSFEAPSNVANNYGQRIRGYVHPPVSGDYTFYIAGDDNCELWLSTNDDPANKTRVAYISGAAGWTYPKQWNRFSSQKSEKVTLAAGRKYYVEVLHKESIGSDHVAVGWQLPDYSLERPIPGIRLSPFAFDGQERIAAEQGAQTNRFSLELYPNPSLGEKLFIQSRGLAASEKVELIIYNGVGNVISTHSLQADESGGLFDEIMFAQKLPAGIYTVLLQGTNQTSTRKLVITR